MVKKFFFCDVDVFGLWAKIIRAKSNKKSTDEITRHCIKLLKEKGRFQIRKMGAEKVLFDERTCEKIRFKKIQNAT